MLFFKLEAIEVCVIFVDMHQIMLLQKFDNVYLQNLVVLTWHHIASIKIWRYMLFPWKYPN